MEHRYVVVRVYPDRRTLPTLHDTFGAAVDLMGRLGAIRCVDRTPTRVACHYRVVEIPPGEDFDYDGRVCAELRAEGYIA